jgi:hypothetical protein
MELALLLLLVVLATEFVDRLGKTLLPDIVPSLSLSLLILGEARSTDDPLPAPDPGFRPLPIDDPTAGACGQPAAQAIDARDEARARPDELAGRVRKMGEAQTEAGRPRR